MDHSKIAFKIDTLFSKIHSISFLNKQCPFLKIYYDSKKASNLKFWLSFLQKTKKLKIKNWQDRYFFPEIRICLSLQMIHTNDSWKPTELPIDSKKARGRSQNLRTKYIIKIEGGAPKTGFCSSPRVAHEPRMRNWESDALR